jgi:hypothetical protein
MRFRIVDWLRGLHNASLERQLREPQKVVAKGDGIKYPPPSLYEVKQIAEEFGLNKSHSMSCVGRIKPNNVYENINKV